jgi:hypothetical protein
MLGHDADERDTWPDEPQGREEQQDWNNGLETPCGGGVTIPTLDLAIGFLSPALKSGKEIDPEVEAGMPE